MTLGQFWVSACANQATGLFVNGSSVPKELFQKINGFLEMIPSTITCCIVPFKNRNSRNVCLLLKLTTSNFLGCKNFAIYHLPHFTKFFSSSFLPLLQLLECLSPYVCGHNVTMKFSLDFHNYIRFNGLVN